MATEPEVTTAKFLVASTLVRFALSKGWKDNEYGVYFRPDSDQDGLHLLFVAEGFDDQDGYECTREVWRFLERELHFEPDVLRSLNLVVRSKKKVEEGGLYAIGPGYQKLWTVTPFVAPSVDRSHEL